MQPADGSVLFIAPELHAQEFVLRLACPPDADSWAASLDGTPFANGDGCPHQLVTGLSLGTHRLDILARLPGGAVLHTQSTYEVRPQ